MKKFLILFCVLFAVVIIPLIAINYIVDPAGVYHPELTCQQIINGFKVGKNVSEKDGNKDERIYKKMLAEQIHNGKSFDYLVIGPSRVMEIDTATVHTNSILNLGVSAAQINDFLAFYQICKDNGIKYKNIIIGCDPTMIIITDYRWLSNEDFYLEFLGKEVKRLRIRKDKLYNLISLSYFQSSIKKLVSDVLSNENNIAYTDDYEGEHMIEHVDGSFSYSAEYRNRDYFDIDKEAGTWMHATFEGTGYNKKVCLSLRQFLNVLLSDNVNVIFFYCPYHPIFYDRIKDGEIFKSGVAFLEEVAKNNNLTIIGSFNPLEAQVANTDFYDAAHLRKNKIDSLFNNIVNE